MRDSVHLYTEKNVPVKYAVTGSLAKSTENIFKAIGRLFEIIGIRFETWRFLVVLTRYSCRGVFNRNPR